VLALSGTRAPSRVGAPYRESVPAAVLRSWSGPQLWFRPADVSRFGPREPPRQIAGARLPRAIVRPPPAGATRREMQRRPTHSQRPSYRPTPLGPMARRPATSDEPRSSAFHADHRSLAVAGHAPGSVAILAPGTAALGASHFPLPTTVAASAYGHGSLLPQAESLAHYRLYYASGPLLGDVAVRHPSERPGRRLQAFTGCAGCSLLTGCASVR
jgi:hypothetical protein